MLKGVITIYFIMSKSLRHYKKLYAKVNLDIKKQEDNNLRQEMERR